MASSLTDALVVVACGAVVALYAWNRYNTPDTNRLSTTRALFLASGAGYVLACIAVFAILSEIVLKPGILSFLGVEDAQKLVVEYTGPSVLSAVLLSTVVLTTLLPNVAVVSTVDAWLLKTFQSWGRIPQGVRTLANALGPQALQVRQADLDDLREWIRREAITPDELASAVSANEPDTPSGDLTRCLLLYRALEKLAEQSAYADAFRSCQSGWASIRADTRVFAAQAHAFFLLFDRLRLVEGNASATARKQAEECFHDICLRLHRQMAEFLAQVLLIVESSNLRIRSKVESLGFYVEVVTCPPPPVGPFVFTGVMVMVGILSLIATFPTSRGDLPLWLLALLIGASHTVAVIVTVVPKLCSSWFRADGHGLPYMGWLVSAVIAGCVAFLLSRAAASVAAGQLAAAWDFAAHQITPSAPMAFVVSLTIGILCDVDLHLGDGWSRRVSEGLLCGLAMALAIYVVTEPQLLGIAPSTQGRAPVWFPLVFAFSLGFIWGFIAPHLYRNARRDQRALPVPPHAGQPAMT